MTLAVIFLISICSTAMPAGWASLRSQSAPAPSSTQDQTTPQASPENKPPAAAPAPAKAATAKRPVHRKKAPAANCDPAPANSQTQAPAGAAPTDTTAAATPTKNAATPAPPKPCPPPKIVVQQGGTAEPSIQLAGTAGGEGDSQQRDATNQMLGATDKNLRNLLTDQLTASQKESVRQIRQFIEQAKTFLDAGDTERARNLAWKAELLSEDLVKSQQ